VKNYHLKILQNGGDYFEGELWIMRSTLALNRQTGINSVGVRSIISNSTISNSTISNSTISSDGTDAGDGISADNHPFYQGKSIVTNNAGVGSSGSAQTVVLSTIVLDNDVNNERFVNRRPNWSDDNLFDFGSPMSSGNHPAGSTATSNRYMQ
jgi:ribosomal protein L31